MTHQIQRVRRDPDHPPMRLPYDRWDGGIFCEASGEALVVVWNGARHAPVLTRPYPISPRRTVTP